MATPKDIAKRIASIRKELFRAAAPEVAKVGLEQIKGRTRLGFDMRSGKTSKQKALSSASVQIRKQIKKTGRTKLHPAFSPARSNLTITGQLVESTRSKIEASKQEIDFFVPNTSRSPIRLSKNHKPKAITNSKVLGYLNDLGRGFLGLDSVAQGEIEKVITASLRRIIKSLKL